MDFNIVFCTQFKGLSPIAEIIKEITSEIIFVRIIIRQK